MSERSEMIEWIRGEIVGPARRLSEPGVASFNEKVFTDGTPLRRGPLVWHPQPEVDAEEVLYFDRESPHRRYGAGLLHPETPGIIAAPDEVAMQATDTVGAEIEGEEGEDDAANKGDDDPVDGSTSSDASEDFEVTGPDVRRPSTIGISFCVRLDTDGAVVIRLPQCRHFAWQQESSLPFFLNGRYELCKPALFTDLSGFRDAQPRSAA